MQPVTTSVVELDFIFLENRIGTGIYTTVIIIKFFVRTGNEWVSRVDTVPFFCIRTPGQFSPNTVGVLLVNSYQPKIDTFVKENRIA
jgi:hypothetical protein